MYGLKTEAAFDSAHFLADYYGKCENLHGHRWRVVVELAQEELQTEGTMRDMVLDFGVFKKAVRELAATLDHTFLVEEGTLKPDRSAQLPKTSRATSSTSSRNRASPSSRLSATKRPTTAHTIASRVY